MAEETGSDLCSAMGAVLRAEIVNCVGDCKIRLIGRMNCGCHLVLLTAPMRRA